MEQLESVESAEAVRRGYLNRWDAEGEYYLGLEVSSFGPGEPLELIQGRMPAAEEELVLTSGTAEWWGYGIGDTLTHTLVHEELEEDGTWLPAEVLDRIDYRVVGIAAGQDAPGGYLTDEGLDRLTPTALPESIRVRLVGEDHGDPAAQLAAQGEIAEIVEGLIASGELPALAAGSMAGEELRAVGPHGIVTVAGMGIATHQQVVDQWVAERTGDALTLRWVALGFGALAVFVSVLVIANTFGVIVASRQRSMALIRAVGATPGQLRRATVAEGAVLGLCSGAAGVFAGWALAQVLQVGLALVDRESLTPVLPSLPAVLIGLALGTVTAALSALLPALRAGRIPPMASLRPFDLTDGGDGRRFRARALAGSLLSAAGLAMVVYTGVVEPQPPRSYELNVYDPATGLPLPLVGAAGAVVAFLGILVLAKLVVPPAVAVLGEALAAAGIAAVPSRLAGRSARQVPGRTAAISAALLIGVTLVVTLTVGAATAQRLLDDRLTENYPVDGVAVLPDDELLPVLQGLEQLEAVVPVAGLYAQGPEARRIPVLVVTEEDFGAAAQRPLTDVAGEDADAFAGYDVGGLDAPDQGRSITLAPEGLGEPAVLNVRLADWVPYNTVVLPESSLPESWVPEDRQAGALLKMNESAGYADFFALEEELLQQGYDIYAGEPLTLEGGLSRGAYAQTVDRVLLAGIALLGASVLVALIGVSNTLSLSVRERHKEVALLRANGMSARGVAVMVGMETLLVAVVTLLLGTGLGVLFGWAGVRSVLAVEDWSIVVQIPWWRMALIWGVTLLAALAAAWLPARRLATVRPAAGLSRPA